MTDQVGSVRAWVDDAGTVAGRADYTTFGERTTDGIVLPLGFAIPVQLKRHPHVAADDITRGRLVRATWRER